ncbi:MAG: FHA domain-containing protein [Myxococcota bacterium]
MFKLIIEDDEGRKTVVPFVREEITIGRQEGNTIRLTERNVSRRHARLVRANGSVMVEDLGSYNGIRINGEKISGQVKVRDGDLIQIGDYDLAIQSDQPQQAPPPVPMYESGEETTSPSTKMNGERAQDGPPTQPSHPKAVDPSAASAFAATLVDDDEPEEVSPEDVHTAPEINPPPPRRQSTSVIRVDQVERNRTRPVADLEPEEAPRLVVLNTELAGRQFACIRTELTIGRTEENDITLDHRSLSRTHATIVREDDGEWRVVDQQSANGLTVNGEPYAQAALQSGDVIELGHVKVRFVAAGEVFDVPGARSRTKSSRLPLFAAASLVVLVLGAGGYWYLQMGSSIPSEATPEAAAPPVEAAPVAPEPERTATAEAVPPEVPEKPSAVEAPSFDKELTDARAAIDELEWDKAREILGSLKLNDGALHPEAESLLAQMKSEESFKKNLDRAEKLIASGKLDRAKRFLDEAAPTTLLRRRFDELTAELERGPLGNVATAKRPAPKPPPEPQAPSPAQEAKRLFDDGVALVRASQAREARTVLEKCLKVDSTYAHCHMMLGLVYGTMLREPEKGAAHYRTFLKLAPNDKAADKVRGILETYESTKK